MGAIQSSINSMLNTAAMGVGLYINSPAGKKMAEQGQIKKALKNIEAQRAAASILGSPDSPEQLMTDMDIDFELDKQQQELLKRQYELNPTTENFESYRKLRTQNMQSEKGRQIIQSMLSPQQQAAVLAQQSLDAEQDRIRAQKDYMNKPRIFDAQGQDIYGRK